MSSEDDKRLNRDRRPEGDCDWENVLPPTCPPKQERPWDKKFNACDPSTSEECVPIDLTEFRRPNVSRTPPPIEPPPPIYVNTTVVKICDSGIGSVTIAEGTITSFISVEDANSIAEGIALAQLRCEFGNTPQTANCVGSNFASDAVITYTTPAYQFTSFDDGGNAANAAALAFAQSQLDCFWEYEASVLCSDIGKLNVADESLGSSSNPSIATAISYESYQAAQDAAEALATSALNCFWLSDPEIFECNDPQQFDDESNPIVYDDFLNRLEPVEAIAGQFISYDSQADANTLRDNYLRSILFCYHYNSEVSSECHDLASPGSSPGHVEAGTIISFESKADADAQAAALAASLSICFFSNPYKEYVCNLPEFPGAEAEFKDECGNVIETEQDWNTYIQNWRFSKNSKGYPGDNPYNPSYGAWNPSSNYDPSQKPTEPGAFKDSSAKYIVIPEGTFISYDMTPSDPEDPESAPQGYIEVRNLSNIMAQSMLDCFYESDQEFDHCPMDSISQSPKEGHTHIVYTERLNGVPGTFLITSNDDSCEIGADKSRLFVPSGYDAIYDPDSFSPISLDNPSINHDNFKYFALASKGLFTSYSSPDEANALAKSYVASLLQCSWGNNPLNVKCGANLPDDQGNGTINDGADIVDPNSSGSEENPIVVGKNMFISTVSKAVANTQAEAYVTAILDCYVTNDQQIAYCGAKIEGEGESRTFVQSTTGGLDEIDGNPPSEGSLGGPDNPVIVEAGLFRSYQSKDEANLQAQILAVSMLNCFWDNPEKTYSCGDPQANYEWATEAVTSVTIKAGTFRSYSNQAEAEELADLLGGSLLDCFYENTGKTYDCTDFGAGTLMDYSDNGIKTTGNNIKPGIFRSYNKISGGSEVAALETLLAQSMLDCFFENTGGDFYCNNDPDNTLGFSEDFGIVHVNIGAGIFRSYNTSLNVDEPAGKQEVALLESLLVDSTLDCFFTNNGGLYTCEGVFGDTGYSENGVLETTVAAGIFRSYDISTGKTDVALLETLLAKSILDCFFENIETTYTCSGEYGGSGYAGDNTSYVVPAGTFRSYSSQDEASKQAQAFGRSFINCYFENIAMPALSCSDIFGGSDYDSRSFVPEIEAGIFRSYFSVTDANEMALAFARGASSCFWSNEEKTSDGNCPPGSIPLNSDNTTVAAGSIISYNSLEDANSLAQNIANALQVCVDPNSWSGPAGPPGDQGPSGNCNNKCAAFYS